MKNKILKLSGAYSVVAFLQRAIGFFLLPLYTKFLSPVDYGIIGLMGSLAGFLSVLPLLGLNGAISRFYFDFKNDSKKVADFWGTIFTFVTLNSLLFGAILLLFWRQLLAPFTEGVSFNPFILILILSIAISPPYTIYVTVLQTKQMGRKFALNGLAYFLLNLIMTICFVTLFKLGAMGVLMAGLITNLLFLVYTLVEFLPQMRIGVNTKLLKNSLKYSLPLVPHSLAAMLLTIVDRVLLNRMASISAVGLYNVGFQFGNIIQVVTGAVNQAYVPWFFENLENNGQEKIIKFAYYMTIVYGYLALALSLFGKETLSIMVTKNFRDAWQVIPFISFTFVFNGMYYFFVNSLFYNKKGTRYLPFITVFNAILNAVLNIVLIPYYGINGAAIASLISMFVLSVLVLLMSSRLYFIGFKWKEMYLTTLAFFGLSLISFYPTKFLLFFFIFKFLLFLGVSTFLAFYFKKWLIQFFIRFKFLKKRYN